MVHLSSFRKVKAFGRTIFICSTGCPSEHPEQRVDVGGERSVISGGNNNTILAQGAVIGGGTNNTVSGNCSVIAGGENNVVTGAYSAILGGNGNNDGGFANTMIVGSGINAVVPGALHVNGLWANGLPVYPGFGPGYAPGTVFVLPAATPPPAGAAGTLWIM